MYLSAVFCHQLFYYFYLQISQSMSNPQAYISHNLNTSKSKEAHVFSKANRFPKSNKLTTQVMYLLPSTSTKRATTFGYGSKISMSVKTSAPPPGIYHLQSDFQRRNYGNTTSIGEGREKITFGSFILDALKQSKNVPSPDRYNLPYKRSTVGGKISDRIKTQPQLREKKTIPGPGTYKLDAIAIKNKGSYILSTYKNISSPRYFTSGSIQKQSSLDRSRFNTSANYDIQEKQVGKYMTSKFKNVITRTFSKSKRPGLEDKSKLFTPGFKYRRFSDFNGIEP